jgi:hypothetical protein
MSKKKRYGDPRKNQARENAKLIAGRSKRELSVGFIFFAWIVFFALWLAVGLLVAGVVFGVLLFAGTALLSAS